MRTFLSISISSILLTFGTVAHSFAQEVQDTTSEDAIVSVNSAEKGIRIIENGNEIDSLLGEVRLYHDSTFMFCDTAVLVNGNELIAFGNVIIIQQDTIQAYCDSLVYNANTKRAQLFDEVILKNGEERLNTNALIYYLDSKEATFSSGAILSKGQTKLSSLRGQYHVNSKMAYFSKNVKVIDGDLFMYTDTLNYSLEEEKAIFQGPTRIEQKESNIYCESGHYFISTQEALFESNPQYIKGEKIAVAEKIFYEGSSGDVVLEGDAQYIEGDKAARALKIVYNEQEDITNLTGDAYYKEGEKELYAEAIEYTGSTGGVNTKGKTTVNNGDTKLVADGLIYNDSIQLGHAFGNVVWEDTLQDLTIFCDDMYYREEDDYVKAFGTTKRPILRSLMNSDTLFLVADTLISLTETDSTSTLKVFKAYTDVKMFKNDFQAVCDSLSYNMTDSLFTLYKQPIMWSDTTQLSGDTINIFLGQDDIDSILITSNGFVVNESSEEVYNQMKGKSINADFELGKLNNMVIEGNAESLYFMKDDAEAYIGMNKTVCNKIFILFEEEDMSDIRFLSNPTSTMTPVISLTPQAMMLEGFRWFEDRRPSSILDLK